MLWAVKNDQQGWTGVAIRRWMDLGGATRLRMTSERCPGWVGLYVVSSIGVLIRFVPFVSFQGSTRDSRFVAWLTWIDMTLFRFFLLFKDSLCFLVTCAFFHSEDLRYRRSVVRLFIKCMHSYQPTRELSTRNYYGRFSERVNQALRQETPTRISSVLSALSSTCFRIFPVLRERA